MTWFFILPGNEDEEERTDREPLAVRRLNRKRVRRAVAREHSYTTPPPIFISSLTVDTPNYKDLGGKIITPCNIRGKKTIINGHYILTTFKINCVLNVLTVFVLE